VRLNVYLRQRGIVTGPRAKSKNTSHSALDVILKHLTNREQFKGGETFLIFGNATHTSFLLNKSEHKGLSRKEISYISAMCKKLWAHPVVRQLMDKAVCEKKKKRRLNGVLVAYILDINQKFLKRGADLKTTTCKTLEEFIEKAIAFGYFRQGETYKVAEGLKDFIFIGIQKEPPFNVYILDVSLYPQEIKYAKQELEFLLYFYQNYGNVLRSGADLSTKNIDAAQAAINQIAIHKGITQQVSKTKIPQGTYKLTTKSKTKWERKPEKTRLQKSRN
jgi:hypothetical protein